MRHAAHCELDALFDHGTHDTRHHDMHNSPLYFPIGDLADDFHHARNYS